MAESQHETRMNLLEEQIKDEVIDYVKGCPARSDDGIGYAMCQQWRSSIGRDLIAHKDLTDNYKRNCPLIAQDNSTKGFVPMMIYYFGRNDQFNERIKKCHECSGKTEEFRRYNYDILDSIKLDE